MKKLLLTLLMLPLLLLTSCKANQDIGWGSYSFHYAHVQMYGMDKAAHFKVSSWKDDEGGIELKITLNNIETSILLGDGTYMLYDTDTCPLCGSVSYKK